MKPANETPEAAETRRAKYRHYHAKRMSDPVKAAKVKAYRFEYNKKYRKLNRVRMCEQNREWRKKNAEHCLEKCANWKRLNPDKHKSHVDRAQKKYNELHIDRRRMSSIKLANKRRAQKMNAVCDNDGVARLMESVRATTFQLCYYCSLQIKSTKVCFDHVIPLSRGGSHTPDNLAISCRRCNSSKNNKLLSEWKKRPFVHIGFDGCPFGWSPEKQRAYNKYWGIKETTPEIEGVVK